MWREGLQASLLLGLMEVMSRKVRSNRNVQVMSENHPLLAANTHAKGEIMRKKNLASLALALPLALSLAVTPDFAEARSKKDNIAIGIGLGLLGGALMSRGDPAATIGGAIAGGVIGGVTSKDRRERQREWRHDYRRHDRDYRGHRPRY